MIRSLRLAAPALALALCAPALADPPQEGGESTVVMVKTGDPRMRAAIAAARRTLPQFLALVDSPPAGTREYTFKYPLGGWEHIWVDHVAHRGDTLTGRLANVPEQEGYRQGQRVTVPIGEVSDWAYRDAKGVMQGHRTTRVLLPRLDPADARAIREAFGWTD